ncbi:MAG: CDP-alcohol phosphatidyltransferase family protein [Geminicoccaceae bacterium]|nr:MAG: CDP-alcohol phosphatidyltransferase family protein [Geminicoccaceae bacterium]
MTATVSARPYANIVTILRILAIPPAGYFVLVGEAGIAFGLILFAALSDALDGWLARRFGATTLGSWLDSAADRLLIATVLGTLWWTSALPPWVVAVLVGREVLVAAGALVSGAPNEPLAPLMIGKIHTAAAFTLLLVAVAVAAGWLPEAAVTLLGAVVLTTSLVSLGIYLQRVLQVRGER